MKVDNDKARFNVMFDGKDITNGAETNLFDDSFKLNFMNVTIGYVTLTWFYLFTKYVNL